MRKCPYCAEEVQDDAVVCRHCGKLAVLPEIRQMAERWGVITQAERDRQWASLDEQRQEHLRSTLDLIHRDPQAVTGRKIESHLGVIALVVLLLFLFGGVQFCG